MVNKMTEIAEQAKNLDYETARNETKTDRAKFLEKFPTMKDWLEVAEQHNGGFVEIASISFADGRIVMLYKFEKAYFCDFHNPNNTPDKTDMTVTLSYEAMEAFFTLFSVMRTDEERRRFWIATGISEAEVDEHLAKENAELETQT